MWNPFGEVPYMPYIKNEVQLVDLCVFLVNMITGNLLSNMESATLI